MESNYERLVRQLNIEITGVSISSYRLNEHIMNQLPTKEQITITKEK